MTDTKDKLMARLNLGVGPVIVSLVIAGLLGLQSLDAAALTLGTPTKFTDTAPFLPQTGAPNRFGWLVTSIADVDSDGVPDIAFGVPFQDTGPKIPGGFGFPENEGEVFIYSGATRKLLYSLVAPDFQALEVPPKFGGKFGQAVVSMGDVDGDGVSDLAVAAPFREVADDAEGEIYLFSGKTGSLIRHFFDRTPTIELAQFGYAMAPLGDVNGDGIPDLLISAPYKPVNGIFQVGEVYEISGAHGALIRTIDAPTSAATAHFGFSVAAVGDLNHDGVTDFAVGAPGQNKVYVFSGATGALLLTLTGSSQPSAGFGTVVSSGKDLNGDGLQDILVGAPYAQVIKNLNQGQVSAFSGADGSLLFKLNDPNSQAFAEFGFSAALINDLSGDGKPDIIVGAPYQDVKGVLRAGEAFVFDGQSKVLLQAITAPELQTFAGFGFSVAADVFQAGGLADPLVGIAFQNTVNPPTQWIQVNQGEALLYPAQ
jgi:FG-GAP repeat protein